MTIDIEPLNSRMVNKIVSCMKEVDVYNRWGPDAVGIVYEISMMAAKLDEPVNTGFDSRARVFLTAMMTDIARVSTNEDKDTREKDWKLRAYIWREVQKEAVSELRVQGCVMKRNVADVATSVWEDLTQRNVITPEFSTNSRRFLQEVVGLYDDTLSVEASMKQEAKTGDKDRSTIVLGELNR